MPQPAEVLAASEALRQAYDDAWASVTASLAALAQGPALARQRRRLEGLRASIESTMDDLDAQAAQWVSHAFPLAYDMGARAMAGQVGIGFSWSQPHVDAVAVLAQDLYDDLLSATAFVRADARRLVREVMRSSTLSVLSEGRTAVQGARVAAAALRERGLAAVVYADGSRHGLAEYADMAVRSKSAVAYNAGAINHGRAFGIEYFEVRDGAGCGWGSHDDPDTADGTIRSADECAGQAISHPRCQRSFGARPDITSDTEAAAATPLGSADVGVAG